MKNFLVSAICLTLLFGVLVPTASAQHTYGRGRYTNGRIGTLGKVGIGAVLGAGIGGLIGGRKGAVIGGLGGAGGGYIWSRRNSNRYYQRPNYGYQRSYNNQPYYNTYPSRY